MNTTHPSNSLVGRLLARLRRPVGSTPTSDRERGSALIISLMIMVILTMMGVTFLVLSEQENKISVNSRDHAQALYLAEAAVNVGLTWFNDPSTSTNIFKPADNQMNLTLRKGRHFKEVWNNDDELAAGTTDTSPTIDGSSGNVYAGGTGGGSTGVKFEKPYRGPTSVTLWGRRDTPDVLLCNSTTLDVDGDGTTDCDANMRAYMDSLNQALLMSTTLRGIGHKANDFGLVEIEQIRVYRPPCDFSLKTRYGIATIEATAIKRVRNQIVSRRTVREVIQEIPFPGPGGAIETEGAIGFSGSSEVHWGPVVAASSNDDINLGQVNNNYIDCSVGRSSSSRFGFHYTINQAAKGLVVTGGSDVTWLTDALGITTTNQSANTVQDPWLLIRARRSVINQNFTGSSVVQPFPYNAGQAGRVSGGEFDKLNTANWSHLFQKQIVRFPPIDYDTWKSISQSGQSGMFYFKWISGTDYKQDGIGPTHSFTWWLSNYGTGVFFFDTQDSKRPTANGSNLTPAVGWDPNMYIQGFIYANSTAFDSSGAGNAPARPLNMPGEPFLDDGIDLHTNAQQIGDDCICLRYDEDDGCVLGARPIRFPGFATDDLDGDDYTCPITLLNGMDAGVALREAQTYRNSQWDSDIDNNGVSDASTDITLNSAWSRFIADNDGVPRGGYQSNKGHGYTTLMLPGYSSGDRIHQGNVTNSWKRDPRFLNHNGDTELDGTAATRQPYEPFLNFKSQTVGGAVASWANGNGNNGCTVNWRADGDAVKKVGNTVTKATTRARDATGTLMNLEPHINGVFYCHGQYTGTGNVKVYGSMLMKGGYASTGSLEIWFNEDLVKGNFPDPQWKLPRVFSTARDTE